MEGCAGTKKLDLKSNSFGGRFSFGKIRREYLKGEARYRTLAKKSGIASGGPVHRLVKSFIGFGEKSLEIQNQYKIFFRVQALCSRIILIGDIPNRSLS